MSGRHALAFAAIAALLGVSIPGRAGIVGDMARELRLARQARPYTMIIVTEPAAMERGEEARQAILAAEPYRRMGAQLDVRIVAADAALMDCQGRHRNIERLITCKMDYVAQVGADAGAHQVLAVTNAAGGGSGGTIPVLGNSDYPAYTLVHELGHTYGLADEYEYTSEQEQEAQCRPPTEKPNSAHFAPLASYASDAVARTAHRAQIPWYGSIAGTTLITTDSSLGTATGIYPAEAAGLFRGGNCNRVIATWKPYAGANFMSTLSGDFAQLVPAVHATQIHRRIEAQLGRPVILIDPIPAVESPLISGERGAIATGAGGSTAPTGERGGGGGPGRAKSAR